MKHQTVDTQKKHPVDIAVGKAIRQRRWAMKMTQQRLAEQVGVKFQQMQKYETGMNRVSASRLWDIAAALAVPVSYFFEGAGTQSDEIVVNREAARLAEIIASLPPDQRASIRGVVEILIGAAS